MVVAVLATWSAYTAMVLYSHAYSPATLFVFGTVYAVSFAVLYRDRNDLLSPRPAFVLVTFVSFLLVLPLSLERLIESAPLKDACLWRSLVVVEVAMIGFLAGTLPGVTARAPLYRLYIAKRPQIRASALAFVIVAGVVVGAAILRKLFHLGEAGLQPSIPYAGYLQYMLFDGVVLICAWFLASSLNRRNSLFLLLGLSLMLALAFTQAMLGWRGGIIQMIVIIGTVLWYQRVIPGRGTSALIWVVVLVLFAGTLMQYGNEVRQARLGGEEAYAESGGDFISNVIDRSQGLTRLGEVVEYVDRLTLTNGFMVRDLAAQGITATQFADREFYGVEMGQSHSVGTSGPGGPLLSAGLLGVASAYALLGFLCASVHRSLVSRSNLSANCVSAGFYAYLVYSLFPMMSGNFGANALKTLFAAAFLSYGLSRLTTRLSSPRKAER